VILLRTDENQEMVRPVLEYLLCDSLKIACDAQGSNPGRENWGAIQASAHANHQFHIWLMKKYRKSPYFTI
jgi:hypothetical protein